MYIIYVHNIFFINTFSLTFRTINEQRSYNYDSKESHSKHNSHIALNIYTYILNIYTNIHKYKQNYKVICGSFIFI